MRQERKLEKAIQRDGEQARSDILDELKRRYPQYVKQADSKQATVKKRRIAVFSSLAAVAECLAIILPCSLLLPNSQPSGGGNDIFYCTVDEYDKIESEYTLGEYSLNQNGNILYFDWYEIAEDVLTGSFVRITNREILGLQESAYNPETDEFITISVTKHNVYLSEFDATIKVCDQEQTIQGRNIKWIVNNYGANCIFENDGYRYFLQIESGQDKNRLFELVEKLLQNK